MDKIMHFTNGNWKIHITEMLKAHDKLPLKDQNKFPFDIRKLNWDSYIRSYVRGSRVYILKEPLDQVDEALRHSKRMKAIHYGTMIILFLIFSYYMLNFINSVLHIF